MRVWVDIENPPQVRYLLPCARALAKSGVDVVITARDYGSTFELLRGEAVAFTLSAPALVNRSPAR